MHIVQSFPVAPDPPLLPRVTAIDSTSLTVSWTPPAKPVDGYIVLYSHSSGNYAKNVSSTKTTLSGLSTGVYSITVHAYKDIPSVASELVKAVVVDGMLIIPYKLYHFFFNHLS